jgi:hypothetical protein
MQLLTTISNIKWLLINTCPSMSTVTGGRWPCIMDRGLGGLRRYSLAPGASLNCKALKLECVCLSILENVSL